MLEPTLLRSLDVYRICVGISPTDTPQILSQNCYTASHMPSDSNRPKAQTPVILNSWKEIASFFDRGVRTVQRWEHELQLPVHRIGKGKHAPVYATISELKFWMATSAVGSPRTQARVNSYRPNSSTRTTQLRARLYQLSQAVAESSVRHQRQTDALQKNLTALRSRVLRSGRSSS